MKSRTNQRKPVAQHPRGAPPHEVRIIGGFYKRTKLPVIDKPGLRPTPDRVRETLFNWLGQDLHGWRCLDAFAGSGALGFEAASRGASQVQMVERDATLAALLQRVQMQLRALRVQVVCGDGMIRLRQAAGTGLDLVFLDPPFDSGYFEDALAAAAQAVSDTGFIYLEAPIRWHDEDLQRLGLQLQRCMKAGMVHAHLLTRLDAAARRDNDPPLNASNHPSCMHP